MRLVLVLAIAAFGGWGIAEGAGAGGSFRVVKQLVTERSSKEIRSVVRWSAPSSYRVDFDLTDEPQALTSLISTDGGESEIGLHRTLETYYNVRNVRRRNPDSGLFRMPMLMEERVRSVKTELTAVPSIDEEEGAVRDYRLAIKYELHANHFGERLRAFVDAVVTYRMSGSEASAIPIDFRNVNTGFAAVDDEVKRLTAQLSGELLQRTLVVTRRIAGGDPIVERITEVYSEYQQESVPSETFSVPAEYRYQEPIFGGPG